MLKNKLNSIQKLITMNTGKILGFVMILLALLSLNVSGKTFDVKSPDENIKVTVNVGEKIFWSVQYKYILVIDSCQISLNLDGNHIFGYQSNLLKTKTRSSVDECRSVVPTKDSEISQPFNELELIFKEKFSLFIRAYNDGIAYRFSSAIDDEITINNELMELTFPKGTSSLFPQEENRYISHYERSYIKKDLDSIKSEQFCSLPVLFQQSKNIHILFTEADLYDYPNMFLAGEGDNKLKAELPKYVLETKPLDRRADRSEVIVKEADYIAKTNGKRDFPWRVFIISNKAGSLIESNLIFQLSRPLKLKDTEWIKPGKVAWDWWNARNIIGVDFEAGVNTETYKYYIDFASEFGIEYIILDEGWSATTTDVLNYRPEVNVPELVEYGKHKDVGVILWLLWKPLDENMNEIFDKYVSWGVKGVKVDFMQRADQYMVNYCERVAKEAAKRKLLVDFHGIYKPVGLRRAYPNVLSYEGLKGLEHNKWSEDITPAHNVTVPFIRMVAGPMDYTPGAMDNAHEKNFAVRFTRPMSMGTRCHQLAMYVIYESPLQMLADSPSNYYRERECTEFISKIPTVWDETIVLDAKVGEYVLVARKNGENWYIGGMTDWSSREFEIDFSFLDEGKYSIEIMQDGINAKNNAQDYKKVVAEINDKSIMNINLTSGGGWAAIITSKNK